MHCPFVIIDEASLFLARSCVKGFLFDENVPHQIKLVASLPITHVLDLGQSLLDSDIWKHARMTSLAIVTKDTDFANRIMVSCAPPWIVHLRFGNLRRKDYHSFLARVWPNVEKLLPEHKLVSVYLNRIEAIKG